jgi:hypothetical protein
MFIRASRMVDRKYAIPVLRSVVSNKRQLNFRDEGLCRIWCALTLVILVAGATGSISGFVRGEASYSIQQIACDPGLVGINSRPWSHAD